MAFFAVLKKISVDFCFPMRKEVVKMSKKKHSPGKGILHIVKDYSEYSTVQGVIYIFQSRQSLGAALPHPVLSCIFTGKKMIDRIFKLFFGKKIFIEGHTYYFTSQE